MFLQGNRIHAIILFLSVFAISVFSFGKNKVTYEKYAWNYLKTPHFDVYFHQGQGLLPKISSQWIENDFNVLSADFNHRFKGRIPLIIYGSPNTFEQTNVIPDLLPEGVGGFTTRMKNRIVIPFDGSYEELRHVLHHELVHGFQNNILYDQLGGALLSGVEMSMPLWFAEGMAEYLSSGWNSEADMFLMDATVFGTVPLPGPELDGYMAYKGGQSFLYYLASTRDEARFSKFLKRFCITKNIERSLKEVYGKTLQELGEEWRYQLKQVYWPEIGKRREPSKTGRALTSHIKDRGFFNLKPRISPDGKKIAYFSDRNDYTQIVIVNRRGKIIQTISQSGFAGNFESFHPFRTGMCWSPSGKRIAFVTLYEGRDELRIIDLESKKLVRTLRPQLSSISSPDWSPDGSSIVFCGVDGECGDLYLFTIASGELKRLTHSISLESDPRFSRDGKNIVFGLQDSSGAALRKNNLTKRPFFNLFSLDLKSDALSQLTHGASNKKSPCFSSDGSSILYVSDCNGIDNLYCAPISSPDSIRPLTNVLGGCSNPDWSKDSNTVVYCLFQKGGWDIYQINDPMPKLTSQRLAPTKWAAALSDSSVRYFEPQTDSLLDTIAQSDTLLPKKAFGHSFAHRRISRSSDEDDNAITEEDTSHAPSVAPKANPDSIATAHKDSADTTRGLKTQTGRSAGKKDSLKLTPVVLNFDTMTTHPYGVSFSPDIIMVGAGVNPYYGSGYAGQWLAVFSDLLGNHQIAIAGDVDGNFSNYTHLYGSYLNLRYKVNFGAGIFYNREFTAASVFGDSLFFDTDAGFVLFSTYPFSMFSRLELNALCENLSRDPWLWDTTAATYIKDAGRGAQTINIVLPSFSYVYDDILWGITGPLNGTRSQATISMSPPIKHINESFLSFDVDFRKYFHLFKRFVWANKVAFGASAPLGGEASSARRFFLGGDENWLNYATNIEGYKSNINNFFYSQIVVPFRGWNYLDLVGSKFAVFNTEFRFPFIKEFSLAWPIPLSLRYINGAVFADIGNAWDKKDEFNNIPLPKHIYGGIGYGLRANLGIFVLRFDEAWKTDWTRYVNSPISYWSLGAEY